MRVEFQILLSIDGLIRVLTVFSSYCRLKSRPNLASGVLCLAVSYVKNIPAVITMLDTASLKAS